MERNYPAEPDFSLIIVGGDIEEQKRAENRAMVETGECWRPRHDKPTYGDRNHRMVGVIPYDEEAAVPRGQGGE